MNEFLPQHLSPEIKPSISWITTNEAQNSVNINELPFEDRITHFLNHPNTIAQLRNFSDDWRKKVIWLIIEYFILFDDWEGIEGYFDFLKEINFSSNTNWDIRERIPFLIKQVAKKLWITDISSDEDKERIYSYFNAKIIKEWYFFHSFNWVFEESIRENWITTDTRMWEWEELDRILEIVWITWEASMLFGWSQMNCKWKISVAGNTTSLYRYWIASPEWFAQFTSEWFHIPNEKKLKECFYRRDYQTAKENITRLCNRLKNKEFAPETIARWYRNITLEEEIEILQFFEKFWNIFASSDSKPKCALIKRKSIWRNMALFETFREQYDFSNETYRSRQISFEEVIKLLIDDGEIDTQLSSNISPDDIKIISLPDYNKVFPVNE